MNINGDYRAIYYFSSDEEVVFTLVGIHIIVLRRFYYYD